jgi:DNA-binding winged helix-turn-helix (wHTH) protein/tetratricopeptide (TPR) repeat protein
MLTRTSETREAINLAHVAPFRLGALEVQPATRQLIRGDRSDTLEPRVMQVLVALAQADGAVVTRDELTDLCWDGRIVSENAINRVISRIRQIASEFGAGAFELETITKVGYRLLPSCPLPNPEPVAPAVEQPSAGTGRVATRRTWLVGGTAALGLGGLGAAVLWRPARDPLPEAVALFQRAQAIREGGIGVADEQVVALLREATRIDPDYGVAWGALALAYAGAASWETRPDRAAMGVRSRAAITRALELDPGNPDARLASLLFIRSYRRWEEVERRLRTIAADHPEHRPTRANLANLLSEVGRLEESIDWVRPLAGADQFNPLVRYRFIYSLWSAGRIEEAEAALDSAWARWPKHGAIWQARIKFLAHTGRPSAALALIQDPSARPIDYAPDLRDDVSVIRALSSSRTEDVDRAIEALLDFKHPSGAANAMQYCAALARTDTAFDLAHGHYLGRGPWAHTMLPENGLSSPGTSLLFNPLTASMRADPRFATLMRDMGLVDYWRRTGRPPDYLRHG